MAQVVPELSTDQTAQEAEAAIVDFRESALRSRFWGTSAGDRLLKWFWRTRLGLWLSRKFADATPEELHGYAFWGMVAFSILVTELLGTGWFGSFEHWPTISSTVGHLQDLNSLWGLPVVGLIAIAAFYALAYGSRPTSEGRSEIYLLRGRRAQLRYGWPLVFGLTALITLAVSFTDADKYQLGYALFGSLAVFGIAVPLVLIWFKSKHVVFPTLFYTFKLLRDRFRWVAAAVAAGLAILVIHLALYPWPNLAREPAKFAGLNGPAARARAERALKQEPEVKPNLTYSTRSRSVSDGQDAWFVYFNDLISGEPVYSGCYVVVKGSRATPAADCLNG